MEDGKVYFYTSTIYRWIPVLQDDNLKELILESLKFLIATKAVRLYGYVIMPNHIHLIIKPMENSKINRFQLSFMRFTAQNIKFFLQDNQSRLLIRFLVNKKDRKYQIWQRNSLAVEIISREMCEQKLDYIHDNPVQGKWMLADSPVEYKYSSSRYYEEDAYNEYPFLTHYMDEFS